MERERERERATFAAKTRGEKSRVESGLYRLSSKLQIKRRGEGERAESAAGAVS